jgi:fumarate reductase flavoprotein subunit
VRTDHRGESPWLSGLFSCGEAACWDMHGFNRLGGNSVAETVVAGMLVGEYVADYCYSKAGQGDLSPALAREFVERERAGLSALAAKPGSENAVALRTRMEQIMTDKVGLFRNGPDLENVVAELAELLARSRNVGLRTQNLDANPELVLAYRLPRMLKIALTVALGALQRNESRGAHYREDFPARNDRDWLNRTLACWHEGDDLPSLDYEALDIMNMELPPGFRGYGVKNIVEHSASAIRQAEVDEMLEARPDRYARQSALMSFKQLLPACYRGRNTRLDGAL